MLKKNKSIKSPREVALPCCQGITVKVTSRESKINERPRNHICPNCGKAYKINRNNVIPA